jgi:SMODS and SLOG-associating 2TM effector domain 1/Protein of unknown function (DUF4231)
VGPVRAFVIRGFGQKSGVDFERVHEELIGPALKDAGVDGGDTTQAILQAGNIRKDMFRELVRADIVVADVSVHNANVFYELGIRHAVRPRSTVLIYAKIDETPFDIKTDRYLRYDPDSPGASRAALAQVLRETLASEDVDSPIYGLLPELMPSFLAALIDLPRSLAEDIEQAREARQAGELRLIADEVMGLRFEEGALRTVAPASEHAGDDFGARRAWERIRDLHPDDFDANHALADIYRRRGQLVLSDQALNRALGGRTLTGAIRAELYAGLGSNSKRRWAEEWQKAEEQEKARVALRSRDREDAFGFYQQGFAEDLNHWYSGLNALALAKVTLELADRYPDDWRNRFDTDAEADRQLERMTSEVDWLTSTVRASINLARSRSRRLGNADVWIEVSAADLRFLTSTEPERVTSAYQVAMSPRLSPGNRRSIREQVEIYRDLGIFTANVAPTLALLGETTAESTVRLRPLIFSGHMIDSPGRVHPRFPASEEDAARREIEQAVSAIKATADERQEQLLAMAGATDGGDLLFHEVCAELGIDTEVFLPVSERTYRATAISGRPGWVERYYAVLTRAKEKAKAKGREDGVHVLARADALPAWLRGRAGYSAWQRSNRWVLHHAWATTTADRVTVLALWNGEPGDGPGGTADMVTTAQAGGADVIVLETGKIFGMDGPHVPQQQPEPTAGAVNPAVAPAGAGRDRPAENADPVLRKVWQTHLQWSVAAGTAQKSLSRWRLSNLVLLVLGAVAAAFAAQTWLTSKETAALAAFSAALLAFAGLIQGRILTSDNTSRWISARAASEALKAETYRYLAGVKPYAAPDRAERLLTQLDTVQKRTQDLLADQQLAVVKDGEPLPTADTFGRYVAKRAQNQADWHKSKVDEHKKKARSLRLWQLGATLAGAALSAVAGALPGQHLAAWTAAATTIAVAFATHIAATQHQRIAASYAATADQLEHLIVAVDPKTASGDRQAQFIADVERVLATQNNGWVDLLSTTAATSK